MLIIFFGLIFHQALKTVAARLLAACFRERTVRQSVEIASRPIQADTQPANINTD